MVEQNTAGRGRDWNLHVLVLSFVRSFVPFFHPFFFPTASLFVSHFVALAGMELITQTKLTLNLCPCLPRTGIVRAC